MEFILSEPEQSYSHVSWLNIATALGCLCVQQRTDEGVAKSTSLFNRYVRSVYDQSLYRVIHTLNPIDFVDEATRVREKSRLDDKSQRFVLAAAGQLGDIMEAYSLILNAWRVKFVQHKSTTPHLGEEDDADDYRQRGIGERQLEEQRASVYLPPSLRPGATAVRERASRFSPQRWTMVLAFLQKRWREGGGELSHSHALGDDDDDEDEDEPQGGKEEREEERRGPIGAAAPPPRRTSSKRQSVVSISAPGSRETHHSTRRRQSEPAGDTPGRDGSDLHSLGPPKPPRRFPAAALQTIRQGHAAALTPLFQGTDSADSSRSSSGASRNSRSPTRSESGQLEQLSAAVSHRAAGSEKAVTPAGSTTPLLASRHGSRASFSGGVTPVVARTPRNGAECASPGPRQPSDAGASISNPATVMGGVEKATTQKKKKRSGGKSRFFSIRMPRLPPLSIPSFSSLKKSVQQFSIRRCYTATRRKCHSLMGVFNIRTSHPLDKAIVMIAGVVFLTTSSCFIGHVVFSGRWGVTTRMMLVGTVLLVLSSLVLFFYLKTTEASQPKGGMSAKSLERRKKHLRPLRRKGVVPQLSSKEQHLLMQLQNYGAPYSSIVLRPLRGWNQKPGSSGWSKAWKFRDLWFSERQSPFSPTVLEVRASINIKNASIGTLQSLFLSVFYPEVENEEEEEEDSEVESEKPTSAARIHSPSFLYPRRTELDIVKQLEYNVFIVRSLEHSRVLGVSPYETLTYVSPAVLLDEDQQKELRIRHPFKDEHNSQRPPPQSSSGGEEGQDGFEGNPAVTSAGYAYMVSLVHCPPDTLEETTGILKSVDPSTARQHPGGGQGFSNANASLQRGTLHHQMWIGFDEPDGSLTLCVYKSLSLPALDQEKHAVYRHTVYRSVLHVVFRLVKALQTRGPLPNELTAYRNNSRYYPFLPSTTTNSAGGSHAAVSNNKDGKDAKEGSTREGRRGGGQHSGSGRGGDDDTQKGKNGDGDVVRRSRTPQPPPGIHWSAETTPQVVQLSALEPLGGLAGKPYGEAGRHRADPPRSPFPERFNRVVLPSALVRFLDLLAASEREKMWEVLSDQSQNGLKMFYSRKPDAKGFRQLKTEVYFPFQGLDAIEMSLLSSFVFPTFGFEVSRREPLWLRKKPARPEEIGLVPVETIYKVRGAERVVSPRSVTMELTEGVHFTAGQLIDMLPAEILGDLPFLQTLSRDTCMFFYGGETSNHEELQQYLSPLDRPLSVEIPSYGFLCWKSQFATEMVSMGSPTAGMGSPTAFPSAGLSNDNPESTAGGVRVIAFVKHGSVRPFQWSSVWSFQKKQVHQIETMIQSIKDMCQQYVSHWVDDLDQ